MNRMQAGWDELVEKIKTLGAMPDAETLAMMRHVFAAGAVVYRRLLFDTVDNSVDPTDVTDVEDQKALDRELDAMLDDVTAEYEAGLRMH
jgi:hypothetical protein